MIYAANNCVPLGTCCVSAGCACDRAPVRFSVMKRGLEKPVKTARCGESLPRLERTYSGASTLHLSLNNGVLYSGPACYVMHGFVHISGIYNATIVCNRSGRKAAVEAGLEEVAPAQTGMRAGMLTIMLMVGVGRMAA